METKEKIDKLYTLMLGLNGADGFVHRGQKAFDDINHIKENMVTKVECGKIRNASINSKRIWVPFSIMAAISVAAIIVGVFV